jgi:signal transduction histidine kinase
LPLLAARTFIALDITMAAGLSLWAANIVPRGEILSTGSDIFWQYGLGTVVIWTAARGLRAGTALVAAAGLLEAAMIAENHQTMSAAGFIQAAGRVGWIAAACLVSWAIVASATRGARIAVAGALAMGREAEQIRVLDDLHDGVLQTLGDIVRRTAETHIDPQAALCTIGRLAHHQADIACHEFTQSNAMESSLAASLEAVAADFSQRGLDVHLDIGGLGRDPIGPVRASLICAVTEAVNNTLRHSHSTVAWIALRHDGINVTIEVADKGVGFSCDSPTSGLGIQNSIVRRVAQVGGKATVVSSIGEGTTVTLVAPVEPGGGLTASGESFSFPRSFDADALEAESLGWFAVPALVYRVCLTPLQVALAYWALRSHLTTALWLAMCVIWAFDLLLLALSLSRYTKVFRSPLLVIVDVALVVGINILAASELPHGSALVPGHEFLWGYTFGLVLLWTALRGIAGGLWMLGIGLLLQATMSVLNGVSWSKQAALVLGAQILKLATALLLAWLITGLARRGYLLAIAAGRRVGIERARAEDLRELFDDAIARLRAITELCERQGISAADRLRQVRGSSLASLSHLRRRHAVLTHNGSEQPAEVSAIAAIVEEFQGKGLRVEFVRSGTLVEAPSQAIRFIATELCRALDNVLEHSGAAHVVVHMDLHGDKLEIVVRDHGTGFVVQPGDSSTRHIEFRADAAAVASARVETWSEPGHGTRVLIAAEWRWSAFTEAI